MKRILTIALGAAMLALPVVAHGRGSPVNQDGHIVGAADSSVKLKDSLGASGRSVKSFAVRNFEVVCDRGTIATVNRAKLSGTIPVNDSANFTATDDNGKTTFKVSGHIGRNKASGGFRYFGSIPGTDGVTRDCDTGKLSWVTRP